MIGSLQIQVSKAFGEELEDSRLAPLKDLNGYFPFAPPASKAEWESRATQLRTQIQVLWASGRFPEKTPLNPVMHGKIEMDDYTVERVYFESMPGFYVTGSLYRPKQLEGPVPAVLCPHGHWGNGRFHDAGEAKAKRASCKGGRAKR